MVGKPGCIAIVRKDPNINAFGLGCVRAIIQARRCAIRGIVVDDGGLGGSLFSAKQRLQWNGYGDGRSRSRAFDEVSSADTARSILETRIIVLVVRTHVDC